MNFLVVTAVGVVGGILIFIVRERRRRRAVLDAVQTRGGMSREDFVRCFSGRVSEQVAAAVFDYFSDETQGHGVDPTSDLLGVYHFDGDLLEECLDALQSALGISNADYRTARGRQADGLQTVEDLTVFVSHAWEAARSQPHRSAP